MMNPDEVAELHNSTDAQEADLSTSASSAGKERMFHCVDCNNDLPVSEALYPTKTNPTVCKGCAAERRKATKEKAEAQEQQYTQLLEAIPVADRRGESKRVTISLSQYATAALEVLAVGRTASEVAEDAVIHYLAEQDSQVIAFVGRIFSQKQ